MNENFSVRHGLGHTKQMLEQGLLISEHDVKLVQNPEVNLISR
jgi:hypothetical protein